MGRTNREWFQGGLHGTKPQTSPAPVICKRIPWGQLHSAGTCLLSARRKQKTIFSWFQRLPSQLMACATAVLVVCPSDCCYPCWPLSYSHPRILRTRGPQVPISSTHSCVHRTGWTSAFMSTTSPTPFLSVSSCWWYLSHTKRKKTHCSHCRWLIRPGCKCSSWGPLHGSPCTLTTSAAALGGK